MTSKPIPEQLVVRPFDDDTGTVEDARELLRESCTRGLLPRERARFEAYRRARQAALRQQRATTFEEAERWME